MIPFYRARARPRIPAVPSRLIAIPVAAGAPALKVEVEAVDEVVVLGAELLLLLLPVVPISVEVVPEAEARAVEPKGLLVMDGRGSDRVVEGGTTLSVGSKSLSYSEETSAKIVAVAYCFTLSGRLLYHAE